MGEAVVPWWWGAACSGLAWSEFLPARTWDHTPEKWVTDCSFVVSQLDGGKMRLAHFDITYHHMDIKDHHMDSMWISQIIMWISHGYHILSYRYQRSFYGYHKLSWISHGYHILPYVCISHGYHRLSYGYHIDITDYHMDITGYFTWVYTTSNQWYISLNGAGCVSQYLIICLELNFLIYY